MSDFISVADLVIADALSDGGDPDTCLMCGAPMVAQDWQLHCSAECEQQFDEAEQAEAR